MAIAISEAPARAADFISEIILSNFFLSFSNHLRASIFTRRACMKESARIGVLVIMNQASVTGAKPFTSTAKVRRFIVGHKMIAGTTLVVAAVGGWYWYGGAQAPVAVPRYVVLKATTGTVIASISGSGQMQAEATIDVKPQISETVTAVPVRVGDVVRAGQLLIQLDTKNEARALTQARLQLQSAELSLAKLIEAPATTTLIQDQNAVAQNHASLADDSAMLTKDYQTGLGTLSGVFVDYQNVVTGLQNFVVGTDINKFQNDPDAYVNLMPMNLRAGTSPYRDAVVSNFTAALAAYHQDLVDYNATARDASSSALDALFAETYHAGQAVSDAVKAVKDLLNYVTNTYPMNQGLAALPTITNTFQTNMGTYTNTMSGDLQNLLGATNAIASDKTAITNAGLAENQSRSALAQLLAGVDPLDVQSSRLSVSQQQLAVQTAEQNLAADSIRAPVSGVVSVLPSVVGATVPSPAVSIVGNGRVAQVTLNEVDAAKLKVGDTATLTFDAMPGLSLAGRVVEIDPVGTVSQGVVNYNVQIALVVANNQIKPGMSVSAIIVTQVHQDVLAVPNAALVKQGSATYILEPSAPLTDTQIASSSSGGTLLTPAPARVPVMVGISNNTMTEITSGVNAGDQIVTQTISGTATAGAPARTVGAAAVNPLRALGGGFGGGRGN
jgi:multidrug efflux pump subunit AcrA (membrane-fusion protein)